MLCRLFLSLLFAISLWKTGNANPVLFAQLVSDTDDFYDRNHSLYSISTSGGLKPVELDFYNQDVWGSGVSTFDHKNAVYYTFMSRLAPATSSLYAFDVTLQKLIAEVTLPVFDVNSMHWDEASGGIYAYAIPKESAQNEVLIYFPTSNCSDVKTVADVSQLGMPNNTVAATALDTAKQILHFIYITQTAPKKYTRVLSSLSLANPTSLTIIPVEWDITELLIAKRAFFDPSNGTIIFFGAVYQEYWSVFEMDPATGNGKKYDISFGAEMFFTNFGSALEVNPQAEAVRTLYLVGTVHDSTRSTFKNVLATWQQFPSGSTFQVTDLDITPIGNYFEGLEVADL